LRSHNKTIFEILGRSPIHPFPARMSPGIALNALGDCKVPLRVLDPMAGSGTVLAVARAQGHRAYGFDLDPLAVLLASAWTRTVKPQQVRNEAFEVQRKANILYGSLKLAEAYPAESDPETRKFIRYWFDGRARRQLVALSTGILDIHDENIRDLLWCAFSRLIITKQAGASLARDLSHSRPHKSFVRAPIEPLTHFLAAVEVVVSNCPQRGSDCVGPPAQVKKGDARKLNVADESIDLVLTSPPYLNAIDYMRCSKFSLVWMGHNVSALRQIRRDSVGAEASSDKASDAPWVKSLIGGLHLSPQLPRHDQALLSRYVWDMDEALSEASRIVRPGGRAVYVVGDSTVRGTFVRNSSIVRAVAERRGLTLKTQQFRALPANRRYLPPPRRGRPSVMLDTRMRREVVLSFEKES